MTHYLLYKTTCQITGKYYCGMHETETLEDGYLGSGKRLLAAVKKYGRENFSREILSIHTTKEELYSAEANLITPEMLGDPLCLNLVPGGKGGSGPGILGASKGGQAFAEKLKSNPEFRSQILSRMRNPRKPGGRWKGFLKGNQSGKEAAWSPEARAKRSTTREANEFQRGIKNSQHGTTCIFNPETLKNKRIPKEDLDVWLLQGWIPGANVGTCFIHHSEEPKGKLIPSSDLQSWIDRGWKKGMRPR
jgi:hypothetical protein